MRKYGINVKVVVFHSAFIHDKLNLYLFRFYYLNYPNDHKLGKDAHGDYKITFKLLQPNPVVYLHRYAYAYISIVKCIYLYYISPAL